MASGTKVQLRLGERVVAEVSFEGAEMRIGRMKENDLVINNLAVSRFHAVLRRVGDAFEIEDLGSENGTLVDGVAICGSAVVPEGVSITIGKHSLSLRAGGEGNTQPPVPRKSDVWDAAQTYFVAGVVPTGDAEAVAVVEEEAEAVPEEDAVAVADEELDLAQGVVELVVDPEPESEESHSPVDAIDEPVLSPAEEVALQCESVAAPLLLDPFVSSRAPEVLPEPAPETESRPQQLEMPVPAGEPLSLADPDEMLGFGEEELVGGAMPDPVAAGAPSAVVEAEEIPMSFGGPVLAPEAQPGLAAIESAGETSLFDFGLTDDLGLSDRSMVRVARADSDASADAGDALHAGLIVERGGRVERVMAWEAPELVVGRAPDCGLVLGGSGVSRRHAELRVDEDVHDIRDLGSANGVYVNGTRVERVALEQGDVIRIDDYTLTFVLDREPVAESVQGSVGSAQGSVGSLQASAAREAERVEASQEPIPERDLVLAEDAELEPVAAEKQLEASASDATSASDTGDPLVWAFEVAIATERLPEGLRRALEEMDAAELVLPAQLRLVRRN